MFDQHSRAVAGFKKVNGWPDFDDADKLVSNPPPLPAEIIAGVLAQGGKMQLADGSEDPEKYVQKNSRERISRRGYSANSVMK